MRTFCGLIRFNSRLPDRTIGDLRAQVSACTSGARRINQMVARHGGDVVRMAMNRISDHEERLARIA